MKIWFLTLLFAVILAPAAVYAHPHVFITPKATAVMGHHAVSQIIVEWDFDEMSSSLYKESCGNDSSQIWATLFPDTQLLADGSRGARSGYYTNISIDGTRLAAIAPAYFQTSYVDGSLHCRFILYVNQVVNHSLKIWFDDATIYNAFDTSQQNFGLNDQSGDGYTLQQQTENGIDKICISL